MCCDEIGWCASYIDTMLRFDSWYNWESLCVQLKTKRFFTLTSYKFLACIYVNSNLTCNDKLPNWFLTILEVIQQPRTFGVRSAHNKVFMHQVLQSTQSIAELVGIRMELEQKNVSFWDISCTGNAWQRSSFKCRSTLRQFVDILFKDVLNETIQGESAFMFRLSLRLISSDVKHAQVYQVSGFLTWLLME